MINKVCNLNCSYCFANEFVNTGTCEDENNITIENFNKAVEFLTINGDVSRVGLIGGEPTVHPKFREIVDILIKNQKVERVIVFSNGINLDKYINLLTHPKVHVLINFNSPRDTGLANYKKIVKNLELMINEYYLKDKITLGINMYKPDFEFDYIIEELKKYEFRTVRTSIVVPNTDEKKELDVLEYFTEMKPSVFKFFKALEEIDVMPIYDCNLMPQCIVSPEEKEWLEGFWRYEDKCGLRCNITDNPKCSPVLDILPNLEVVRCFGCSEKKTNLFNFDSISDIDGYFLNEIDKYANLVTVSEKCNDCYYNKTQKCYGGCIAFKNKKIEKIKKLLSNVQNEV